MMGVKMKPKSAIFLTCFVFTLLALVLFVGCGKTDMQLQDAFDDYSRILAQELPDDLSLKIYYIGPLIATRAPLTVDDLIHFRNVHEIDIDSAHLKEHIDLLQQLKADHLVPVKQTSFLDAKLCYIFETDSDGKVLEVAFGGIANSVFVNGIEVENNDIFLQVLDPFVAEDVMNDFEYFFGDETDAPTGSDPTEEAATTYDNNCTLIINGVELSSAHYVHIDHERRYAELPLAAVVEALGATVEWDNNRTARITYHDSHYKLDVYKVSLVKNGDLFNMIALPPGEPYGFYQMIGTEFVVGSNSLRLLIRSMDADIQIDYENSVVSIDTVEQN